MSEHDSPDQLPPESTPPGRPGPGWAPAALSGHGHAGPPPAPGAGTPTTAGGPPHPSPSIGRYAPKRTLGPVIISLIALIVAALVAYSALRPTDSDPAPSASSTPTAHAPHRDGTPFTVQTSGATGIWKVAEHRWNDQGLSLLIELTVDSGQVSCYFNALSNTGQEVVRGASSGLSPAFPTSQIRAGETVSGWVYFPIDRGTTLIFLRTKDQAQVSGIEVSG